MQLTFEPTLVLGETGNFTAFGHKEECSVAQDPGYGETTLNIPEQIVTAEPNKVWVSCGECGARLAEGGLL
jgi:hypothetical protein